MLPSTDQVYSNRVKVRRQGVTLNSKDPEKLGTALHPLKGCVLELSIQERVSTRVEFLSHQRIGEKIIYTRRKLNDALVKPSWFFKIGKINSKSSFQGL